MGIVEDVLRFISVAILGMKDATKVFNESLEMAERYVRWGEERKDIRDYLSALQNSDKCLDEDASKQDLLLRKYTAQLEAILGILQLQVEKFSSVSKEKGEERKFKHDELETEITSLKAAKEVVKKLKSDGSMIKVKDEERRVDEIERHILRLKEDYERNETEESLRQEFVQVREEFNRMQNRLELAVGTLQRLENIDAKCKENVIAGVLPRQKTVCENLELLAPDGMAVQAVVETETETEAEAEAQEEAEPA